MEAHTTDVYEFPAYYDVLFDRNYPAECDFMEACLRRHGATEERSFVELGCGPAHNARELARRGWRAAGLDLSSAMLAYAEREARRAGVSIELVKGDFTDFDLPQKAAVAACLWDTIFVVLRNEDMIRHLRAVARNLTPGGVYIIETTHPRYHVEPYQKYTHRGQNAEVEVELTWGRPDDPYDCIEQRYLVTVELVARQRGEVVARQVTHVPQRCYRTQELRALIALSGAFAEVHFYGRTDLPLLPLSDEPECDGMVAVLVKR
jgi:SAM-dependent methyltransferase